MTLACQRGHHLTLGPKFGCTLLHERGGFQDVLDGHHDGELGNKFAAANAAAVHTHIAMTGALHIDHSIDEELRHSKEVRLHVFCPAQQVGKNKTTTAPQHKLIRAVPQQERANISGHQCFPGIETGHSHKILGQVPAFLADFRQIGVAA